MAKEYVVIRRQRRRERRGPMAHGSATLPESDSLAVDVVPSRNEFARLRADQDVKAAAPSMSMRLIKPVSIRSAAVEESPTNAAESIAWGVRAVGADSSSFDGTGVVIAILDTGIDSAHPAFNNVELVERDFTGEGSGDIDGHGTHCAGTIFGRDVAGVRIGIARGIKRALIGKVIGSNGASSAGIVSAIDWAIRNGANVISMSLGIDFPGYQQELVADGLRPESATSLALEAYRENLGLFDSIRELVNSLATFYQPCLLIAAAGNESGRDAIPPFEIAASPPAASKGFVSVAALQQGERGLVAAPFSNTGARIAAPGVGITSAKRAGGLVSMDGTSMATPHVAGVAALLAQKLQQTKTFKTEQFVAELLASASRAALDGSSTFNEVGAGIVRAVQT